ncbi:uncharacterized protein LOC124556004 [Schistocerca americana]|uniref:uncharacterized protein LOC124556004 n=1 Tax=Schistocerca americana TaxID=7009 RepID=UPI001F4F81ED|nr:uncharacterized protein LOC124556004 [Schistocerca americana]
MCPNNYRPVSLLPTFSKIIERIIFVRLMAFFDKNSIINGRQFGFQKGKSTVSAAFQLINIISAGLDQDDTTRITVRPSLQEAISKSNQTVEIITHWLEVNRLILNYEKTNAILFRNNKRKTRITEDSWLRSKDHISNIRNKISSAVFALR